MHIRRTHITYLMVELAKHLVATGSPEVVESSPDLDLSSLLASKHAIMETWSPIDEGYYTVTPPSENADYSSSVCDDKELAGACVPPRNTLLAVIGVGYVGMKLVTAFSSKYDVLGFDISETRIRALEQDHAGNKRFRFSTQPTALSEATHRDEYRISKIPWEHIESVYTDYPVPRTDHQKPSSHSIVDQDELFP